MSLRTLAKLILSSDYRTLVKAKYLNDDLTVTDRGRAAIDAITIQANLSTLVSMATDRIAEDKDECSK